MHPHSHAEGDFLTAHGELDEGSRGSCVGCHGERDLCSSCHGGVALPHAEDWLDTHGKGIGFTADVSCLNCHEQELCGMCHEEEFE